MDHKVTGVGGTPVPVRLKYRIGPAEYDFAIRLKPISRKDISLMGI